MQGCLPAIVGFILFFFIFYELFTPVPIWASYLLSIGILLFFGFFILGFILKNKKTQQEAKAREDFVNQNRNLTLEEILENNQLLDFEKSQLLQKIHGLSMLEAQVRYKNTSAEEIILDKEISEFDKGNLLMKMYGYNEEEITELIQTAKKEEQKARLKGIKRKISQKAMEQYGDVPTDDRQPIADDVKTYVWQRDKGRCVKCGNNEKLEFDHIIPFSKGGSNTERNLQLLCEKCNREKSANI